MKTEQFDKKFDNGSVLLVLLIDTDSDGVSIKYTEDEAVFKSFKVTNMENLVIQ